MIGMATYILQDKYNSRNFDKDYPYHVIEAQGGLDGIKKEAYNKVPNGYYRVYTKNGKRFGSVSISEESKRKAERKRPVLPKEQYNQLYFYVEIGVLTRAKVPQGKNPLDYIPISPRRHDSLTDARRAALSNSHKTYTNNKAMEKYYDNWTANHPTEMCGAFPVTIIASPPWRWKSRIRTVSASPLSRDRPTRVALRSPSMACNKPVRATLSIPGLRR